MTERIIAIGDVHGCSAALAALVRAIDPTALDTLVFLGDYIDPDRPLHEQRWGGLRWASLPPVPVRHCSGKVAIVGHTAQKSGEILDLGYLKCIDTFCHGGGWLTALEVQTGKVWQASMAG